MATYDETLLLTSADSLLKEARTIIATKTITYSLLALFASLIGLGVAQAASKTDFPIGVLTIGITVVAGLLGFREGLRLSFQLRLEAHKTLALVEIERNTRKSQVARF